MRSVSTLFVVVLVSASAACSSHRELARPRPAAVTTSIPLAAKTIGTASCHSAGTSKPSVTSTERLDHTATDGANYKFASPGSTQPSLSAATALGKLQPNSLSNSVDAVLAVWTNLTPNPDAAPHLVWVLRNQNVAVAPSLGPVQCGEVTYVVDASNGTVYFGASGAALI